MLEFQFLMAELTITGTNLDTESQNNWGWKVLLEMILKSNAPVCSASHRMSDTPIP